MDCRIKLPSRKECHWYKPTRLRVLKKTEYKDSGLSGLIESFNQVTLDQYPAVKGCPETRLIRKSSFQKHMPPPHDGTAPTRTQTKHINNLEQLWSRLEKHQNYKNAISKFSLYN